MKSSSTVICKEDRRDLVQRIKPAREERTEAARGKKGIATWLSGVRVVIKLGPSNCWHVPLVFFSLRM